jgi:hypothetical protein
VHVGRECPLVLRTRSGEGMLACKEVASAGAVGGHVGGRGSWLATGSRKVVFEVKRDQGNRTEEVKE